MGMRPSEPVCFELYAPWLYSRPRPLTLQARHSLSRSDLSNEVLVEDAASDAILSSAFVRMLPVMMLCLYPDAAAGRQWQDSNGKRQKGTSDQEKASAGDVQMNKIVAEVTGAIIDAQTCVAFYGQPGDGMLASNLTSGLLGLVELASAAVAGTCGSFAGKRSEDGTLLWQGSSLYACASQSNLNRVSKLLLPVEQRPIPSPSHRFNPHSTSTSASQHRL